MPRAHKHKIKESDASLHSFYPEEQKKRIKHEEFEEQVFQHLKEHTKKVLRERKEK